MEVGISEANLLLSIFFDCVRVAFICMCSV